MAEAVQYQLERMVPELEDLERRSLFTKSELKAIVKKRTNFEYSLKRRKAPCASYLRYIEYEMNVDALRTKRKQRMKQMGQKITLSDYSITQRIISIYERALIRHRGNVALWIQYIDFLGSRVSGDAEQGYARALAKVYARAIMAHPYGEELWVGAAAHELESNVNGHGARALLQRALRVNPKSQKLWIEYFRLEVMLVEKIRARRRVLGIDGSAADKDNDGQQEEEDDGEPGALDDGNVIKLDALDEENAGKDGGAVDGIKRRIQEIQMQKSKPRGTMDEDQRRQQGLQNNEYLQGAVPKLIYEQAILAVPKDLGFREEFASIYRQYGGFDQAYQRVLQSIEDDFAMDPKARAYLCTAHLGSVSVGSPELVDALKLAVEKYAAALVQLDGPEMWTRYVDFLVHWRDACKQDLASLHTYFSVLIDRALASVMLKKQSRASPQLALMIADCAVERGKRDDALDWLRDATEMFSDSDALWVRRLGLLADGQETDEKAGGRVERLFESDALAKCPGSKALWDQWLTWLETRFRRGDVGVDRVQTKYLASFIRTAQLGPDYAGLRTHLQVRYVEWAWSLPQHIKLRTAAEVSASVIEQDDDEDGAAMAVVAQQDGGNVESLRKAYNNVARHAFPTIGFYRRCLELEPDAGHRRLLHEMACRVDALDIQAWLDYLRFLLETHSLDAASAVLYRASKAMPDEERRQHLDSAYQSLQAKISAAGSS
ncbi:U3 snoRNP protein [Coemansia sp. RSA 2599]|nr:U3 snoRNP protein [Coemansia sp. RSA 2598]KAJ1828874.1 U3 snoRNP protein [Coemansia sp. RSA 2599]